MRKPPKGKSLAELNPDLAKEWHPTKNGSLTTFDVSPGSEEKVWWKCDKGIDHEWKSIIYNRKRGSGCPICSGHKVVLSNCLATLNPELAKEWHPTKNDELTPFDVTEGTHRKVWWKCDKGHDHEWMSSVYHRSYGRGCPVCRGLKVVLSNCLATLNPELAKEWHPTKNDELTPFGVTDGTPKKVWWKCPKGDDHEWKASIANRSQGNDCSICSGRTVVLSNCLATLNPKLAKEWHPRKNPSITPFDVSEFSHKKVWWKCDKGDDHEWESAVSNRSKGKGCPICSGKTAVKSNCLATLNPELAKEWHPIKNGSLTPFDVSEYSNIKVWWKCPKGDDHEWISGVSQRSKGNGCPICSGDKVVISNCLATLNPILSKEWHPTKNGDFTPYNVTENYSKKIWWKCDKGDDHEWLSTVNNRSQGKGCPICSNQKTVLSNCLETLNPELAKEWHPTKNDELTPFDVTEGTHRKVWWKCDKSDDHEWISAVRDRSNGNGCPFCTLTPQSRQELTISFELQQFFDINPKGFKTRIHGKLWTIDIYIPELNLGIEFDGSYWHKDKRALDKLKTEKLKSDGFKIMRIREEPLKSITGIDVISKIPFNAKVVTNEILKHIMTTYSVEPKKVKKIEKYLHKEEIQNEKGLDAYIDMILTEKGKIKKRTN